jgi:iron complex transport system substrate-binding protein
MRAFALISSALLLIAADAPETPRIVSTSLCGDSYVLDMVPDEHIAALSWQADDLVSKAPLHLRKRAKAWDDIERLLALNPTLVVFGPGEGAGAKPLLEQAGINTLKIEWAGPTCSIECNIEKLKDAGYEASYRQAPAAIAVNPPNVLYLSRAGGTAGPGTYVDEAITAAGGLNMIKTGGWFTPDPETLVSLAPDLIVTSFFEQGYESINANGMTHSLMRDKLKTTPNVNVPGALWPCPGPGLNDATALIADAIDGLER